MTLSIFGPAVQSTEMRTVTSLTSSARNSRVHSDEQVAQLVRSMRMYGWTMPVLIDEEDRIIAGHGRILAAAKLGWTEVPCLVARDWSDEQRRTYVIADNQITLLAEWDDDILATELENLRETSIDLTLTGFSAKEIDRILDKSRHGNEDAETGQIGEMEYRLVVDCRDETHQAEMLARLEAEGLKCKALIS